MYGYIQAHTRNYAISIHKLYVHYAKITIASYSYSHIMITSTINSRSIRAINTCIVMPHNINNLSIILYMANG